MSDRLTSKWTATAAEAYGISGDRGRQGEVLVCSILERNGFEVQDFEEQYKEQVAGVDILVNGHTIDVKCNLHNKQFWIETGYEGWLFNSRKTSDIILHVDLDTEDVVWYTRESAKTKVRKTEHLTTHISESKFHPGFMSRSWDDLFTLLQGDKCSLQNATASG